MAGRLATTSCKTLAFAMLLQVGACTAPAERAPVRQSSAAAPEPVRPAADDGSYLQRIDPLGGQWLISRLGETDFTRFRAWIGFSDAGFLNHGAGCGGGYPAFYRLEGERIEVTRLEPVRTGKCAGTSELANGTAAARAIAVESEQRLGRFIDQLSQWSRQGDTLILTARDGTRAMLARPTEPNPEIAGRWLVDSIGGEPLITERRPATVTIERGSIGAAADCNGMGTAFKVIAPGRISVAGPITSTAMGCPPEDQAEDALLARAITSVTGYQREGDRLVLTGGPGLVLRRPPPPDRRLAGEYASCGNTPRGIYNEGPTTLVIDDETMRENASCSARYQADGPNLKIALAEGPACSSSAPPYSAGKPIGVGGSISVLSVMRPDAYAFNDRGQLILRTERGLLTLCRKGAPLPFGS